MTEFIPLDAAAAFAQNASQALGLLAFAGVVAGILRWNKALRRDFLVAFVIFLLGTAMREMPPYIGGMTGWGAGLVLLSGVARFVQIVGAAMFIRASLKNECPPWGWKAVVGVVVFFAWVI